MDDLRPELKGEIYSEGEVLERFRLSEFCETAVYDGQPIAMVGFLRESMLGGNAFGWMLVTNRALEIGLPALRLSARYMDRVREKTDLMNIWTVVRFAIGVQWLRWIGFRVSQRSRPHTFMEWRR